MPVFRWQGPFNVLNLTMVFFFFFLEGAFHPMVLGMLIPRSGKVFIDTQCAMDAGKMLPESGFLFTELKNEL